MGLLSRSISISFIMLFASLSTWLDTIVKRNTRIGWINLVIGRPQSTQMRVTGGAFHSTKITGSNFRNFRWSNGTRPTASQNSRSRALQQRACWVKLLRLKMNDFLKIFAALEQHDCETISCTILYRNKDVILVAAIACFMRRELTRVNESAYRSYKE